MPRVGGIHAGEQGGARHGADRRVGIGVRVAHALGGEGVEVRRLRLLASVAAEVGADVLAGDPEDVGPVGGGPGGREGREGEEESEGAFHDFRSSGLRLLGRGDHQGAGLSGLERDGQAVQKPPTGCLAPIHAEPVLRLPTVNHSGNWLIRG